MANPELGAKQVCTNCQAKFYDLGKRPAHCPKCHTEFDPDEVIRNRRVRGRAPVPEAAPAAVPKAAPKAEEAEDPVKAKAGDEDDEVATSELDEAVDDRMPANEVDDDDKSEPKPKSKRSAVPDDLVELSNDDDADVPFIQNTDDDFDDSEVDGLPGKGAEEDS